MKDILAKYQKQLRLMDWDVEYLEIPSLSGEAQTKLLYNDYKAVMQVNAELKDSEKELSIIHELLHLVFRDAYDIFAEQCPDEFTKTYCERQHERAIEKTAKIIYSLNHKVGG